MKGFCSRVVGAGGIGARGGHRTDLLSCDIDECSISGVKCHVASRSSIVTRDDEGTGTGTHSRIWETKSKFAWLG